MLGWIKTLIGELFHADYTVEDTWKLMRPTAGQPRSRCARRWNAMIDGCLAGTGR